MRLVDDGEVPGGDLERRQHLILLGEVDRGDDLVVLLPDVAAPGRADNAAIDRREGLGELLA